MAVNFFMIKHFTCLEQEVKVSKKGRMLFVTTDCRTE